MKCKLPAMALMILVLIYTSAARVEAATSSATVALSVTIAPYSQLTLNDNSDDPNIKSSSMRRIADATANARTGSAPVILTVGASNDSIGQTDIDPAMGATGTASDMNGNFFPAAPPARNEAESGAAVGEGCLASYSETFNWYLEKSWHCSSPGKDSFTVTYTLTSP